MIKQLFSVLISSLFFTSIAHANLPYFPIEFPRDEAAHYANVPYPVGTMSEWWYYNGKLVTTDGKTFGYYISFNSFEPEVNGHKIHITQLGVQLSDVEKQKVYGNRLILQPDQVTFSTKELDIEFGKNATLTKTGDTYVIHAELKSREGQKLKFDLKLTPNRPPLLINKIGLADMWDNTNTYYYSMTNLRSEGSFQVDDTKYTVDPVQSLSWMDHQWGDFLVIPGRNQWSWSSIQLENGLEINISSILDNKTKEPVNSNASIMMPDGSFLYTKDLKITARPDPLHRHPIYYDVVIPSINLELLLTALVPDQDINGISEGISKAEGKFNGEPIRGFATAESNVIYPQNDPKGNS